MSRYLYDSFIGGYAETKNKDMVEKLLKEMQSEGFGPREHTYTHILKLHYHLRDFKAMANVVDTMSQEGLEMNLDHYSLLMRMCFKTRRLRELFQIFDLLKFRATTNLPDERIYSIAIGACGAMKDTERALDLYKEMTTRPLNPLEPNQIIMNALIYACSTRREYHYQAWQYLLESRNRGYPITQFTIELMLNICAVAGDVAYARLLLLQLYVEPSFRPCPHSFQCLFRAYSICLRRRSSLGANSALDTDLGMAIQKALIPVDNIFSHTDADLPPFLPVSRIANVDQLLAEAHAVMRYLQGSHPDLITDFVVNTYLSIASNNHQNREYRLWFAESTAPMIDPEISKVADCAYDTNVPGTSSPHRVAVDSTAFDEDGVEMHTEPFGLRFGKPDPAFTVKVLRNRYIYQSALELAFRTKDFYFGKAVYAEREAWKKTKEYETLPPEERQKMDFKAVQFMVDIYARAHLLDKAWGLVWEHSEFPWVFDKHLLRFHTLAKQSGRRDIIDKIVEFTAESRQNVDEEL
ncbi:hypothetical protein V1520DRAFT_366628 [Lipomyces starkeyi]|uniref:Pentacotripeptide-repeat region of PRORP domain-containing protein n=1 Tax=Lipomyces starkeyi NRRL Y-11557 TaxID=675824 RepID=A0A1E3Q7D6_LIPST|nr:hypothetical protein LIPSTDRAFT_264960 [Lipomyces starkeyi NRRL Y-11557]